MLMIDAMRICICLCSTVIKTKIKLLFRLTGRTSQNSKATKDPALVICRLPLISPKYSIKISKTRSILRAVILAWKLTPLIVNFLSTMGCYTPLFLVLLPPSYRIAPPTDPSTPSYNLFPLPFFVQCPTVRAQLGHPTTHLCKQRDQPPLLPRGRHIRSCPRTKL